MSHENQPITAAEEESVEARRREANPLVVDDTEAIVQLRKVLEEANFTDNEVQAALGEEGDGAVVTRNVSIYLRRLPSNNRLSTLIKLFLLGVEVDTGEADQALAPLDSRRLEAIGVLKIADERAQAKVRVVPNGGMYFAYDMLGNTVEGEFDQVMGVNPSTLSLAYITVRRPVKSALDMGTGCGLQAIVAANHAERVTATDINPRALNVTAFNAVLNGKDNIEYVTGDFFEPVKGRRFDVIVTNPPYIISPDFSVEYRDSSLPGDQVSRQIVQDFPTYMNEGAYAHTISNWAHGVDEHWSAPLRKWVEDSGCDALFLHSKTSTPLDYAINCNKDHQTANPDAFSKVLDRWLEYYDDQGIKAISSGAIVLRRRSDGPNWVRADELPPGKMTPCGDHIARIFENQDYLFGLKDDAELLEEAFSVFEQHSIEQTLEKVEGEYTVKDIMLRLEHGIRFQGRIDGNSFLLLTRCDGRRTLAQLVFEMAQVKGLDRDELTRNTLPVFRRLLELGFLLRGEA